MNQTKICSLISKYKSVFLFNKNLILSGIGGFFISAYVSELYTQFDTSEFANSLIALATEYAVYIPLFSVLFYVDNRQKYLDPATGKKNNKRIMDDIKKLFVAFSVSEIIYSVTRITTQYGLLVHQELNIETYEASMVSSLAAWGVFLIAINVMAKLTRLFRESR
jgi:cytochrome bd-type quinol oxidase subunit 2